MLENSKPVHAQQGVAWIRGATFHIVTKSGDKKEVSGATFAGFGIHEKEGAWVLTHIASGARILTTNKWIDCKRIAEYLAALPDQPFSLSNELAVRSAVKPELIDWLKRCYTSHCWCDPPSCSGAETSRSGAQTSCSMAQTSNEDRSNA